MVMNATWSWQILTIKLWEMFVHSQASNCITVSHFIHFLILVWMWNSNLWTPCIWMKTIPIESYRSKYSKVQINITVTSRRANWKANRSTDWFGVTTNGRQEEVTMRTGEDWRNWSVWWSSWRHPANRVRLEWYLAYRIDIATDLSLCMNPWKLNIVFLKLCVLSIQYGFWRK